MKRSKKKKDQSWNLIIMPGATAKPFNINLSRALLSTAVISLGVILVIFISLGSIYFYNLKEIHNMQQIKAQYKQKNMELEALTKNLEDIAAKQKAIEEKQEQVKKLVGIKSKKTPPGKDAKGGKGGEDESFVAGDSSHAGELLRQLEQDLAAQEEELEAIVSRVNKDPAYYHSLPNQWPAEGEVSSEFGWRRSPFGSRKETYHNGIDIANVSGVTIVAAGDGTVTYSAWKPAYGRTIEIYHGQGLTTRYGHNSALLVKEGDKVKKGDPIALMGSTGHSTGPHLHFTVFQGDQAVDPMLYLP
ncbi:M23 family metallopeptidase [Syntrophomonas palmitatica]|uniref:M23 family metallopeptidase n=1 Tax=Syntrophomonas palmitatica TaxID=402877 RepID=UPI0006D1CD79|nr:M23 family metallopeptidase [Syntrophomonas palmitatica]